MTARGKGGARRFGSCQESPSFSRPPLTQPSRDPTSCPFPLREEPEAPLPLSAFLSHPPSRSYRTQSQWRFLSVRRRSGPHLRCPRDCSTIVFPPVTSESQGVPTLLRGPGQGWGGAKGPSPPTRPRPVFRRRPGPLPWSGAGRGSGDRRRPGDPPAAPGPRGAARRQGRELEGPAAVGKRGVVVPWTCRADSFHGRSRRSKKCNFRYYK